MSMASSHAGSVTAKPSGQVMTLMTMPSTRARPGKVLSSHVRHTLHRDSVSPGSNAGGRTDSLIGRLPEYPFLYTKDTKWPRRTAKTPRQ